LGVDTHLYLLDYRRYINEVKPLLDGLLGGGDPGPARVAYEAASTILIEAHRRHEYPWTPFYSSPISDVGLAALDGHIPETYSGDRVSFGSGDIIRDPHLIREYCLRDKVCGVIVEGLCVPWDLEFPPVHIVTWCLGGALYEHSRKFEDALCGEIYQRSSPVPYDIYLNDELVDDSLVAELAVEIARIASAQSELWVDERYRNLYKLLQLSATSDRLRILASYS
jgi:hypothetical protein